MTARAPYPTQSRFRSSLENDYYNHLYALQAAGEIRTFSYESWKVKVSEGTRGDGHWFKPDFMVITRDGEIEFHETKGSKQARGQKQALTRLDAAAGEYPEFRWVLVEGSRGGWKKTEVK